MSHVSEPQRPVTAAGPAATGDFEAGQTGHIAPGAATVSGDVPTAGPPRGRRVRMPRSTLLRHVILLAAGAVVAIVLLENTSPYTNSQLAAVTYYAIAAGGLTVLTGLNGQISLGHGALMAIGAYTTALLLGADNPLPLPAIFLIALGITTAVGAVVGVAAARLHGPYLAGATLALAVGLPGVAIYLNKTFGGEQGLTVLAPPSPGWFGTFIAWVSGNPADQTKWLAYLGTIILLITFFLLANLARSRVGRTWRAVRDNEVAAELSGISLGAWRVTAFVVSAACAGLGGAVLALVVRLAAPSAFTLVLSLSLLTAIVIGGLGSLVGAILGSVLLVFLPPAITDLGTAYGMNNTAAAQLAPLVYGLVLALVMIVAPAGFVGTIRLLWRGARGRRPSRAGRG